MPADIRPSQVIGLVEKVGENRGRIRTPKLANELGADLTILPSILKAGEILGLILEVNGEIQLTKKGLDFRLAPRHEVKMLTEALSEIEPFRTALELAAKQKSIVAAQVANTLLERGIEWHYQEEVNVSIINALLINWTIGAGLLQYDKSGGFRKT
jgi:hypothetical protein